MMLVRTIREGKILFGVFPLWLVILGMCIRVTRSTVFAIILRFCCLVLKLGILIVYLVIDSLTGLTALQAHSKTSSLKDIIWRYITKYSTQHFVLVF